MAQSGLPRPAWPREDWRTRGEAPHIATGTRLAFGADDENRVRPRRTSARRLWRSHGQRSQGLGGQWRRCGQLGKQWVFRRRGRRLDLGRRRGRRCRQRKWRGRDRGRSGDSRRRWLRRVTRLLYYRSRLPQLFLWTAASVHCRRLQRSSTRRTVLERQGLQRRRSRRVHRRLRMSVRCGLRRPRPTRQMRHRWARLLHQELGLPREQRGSDDMR